jgi:hypothetical protein
VQGEYPSHGAQFYMEAMKTRLLGERKWKGGDCIKNIYIYINKTGLEVIELVLFDVTEILEVVNFTTLKELTNFRRLDIFLSLAGAEEGTT